MKEDAKLKTAKNHKFKMGYPSAWNVRKDTLSLDKFVFPKTVPNIQITAPVYSALKGFP